MQVAQLHTADIVLLTAVQPHLWLTDSWTCGYSVRCWSGQLSWPSRKKQLKTAGTEKPDGLPGLVQNKLAQKADMRRAGPQVLTPYCPRHFLFCKAWKSKHTSFRYCILYKVIKYSDVGSLKKALYHFHSSPGMLSNASLLPLEDTLQHNRNSSQQLKTECPNDLKML